MQSIAASLSLIFSLQVFTVAMSDDLFTSTLDGEVLASIRQCIADFFQRCGLQYKMSHLTKHGTPNAARRPSTAAIRWMPSSHT
ncbi:hypothetical protein BDR03DRAFT_940003 [Suillus americanus]|nr:hypothetical protein BDR03DRAFT_940003 [Suillus americanus]